MLAGGCSHLDEKALSKEANQLFNQGNYAAALDKYAQIIENHPGVADRVLFEMGVVYAYPHNAHKDYRKSLECLQTVVRDYPDSDYRHDSQMLILQIHNVILKDEKMAAQQAALERSRQALELKTDEVAKLQETVAALEEKVFAVRMEPADKILIQKQARRLTLLAKGEVIKSYPIALGGNPVGPKEKEGDNKTPEGYYFIDSRNGNSGFHLSLHISYPNEQDKMRARELGVCPGGDIMIHGLKNGFSPVGASHAQMDWTEGCIAVTNQEMEEIYRLVPNGTLVEITP
ncbi:L,D-transpeptidase family protein [uncultured Desulfosarcina sp.]|uniref:L,D-transpeptidase family protein n=1 Tax=uncultured Desulfosarcina sp. TaxID=218289 RepID=UPI0037487CF3